MIMVVYDYNNFIQPERNVYYFIQNASVSNKESTYVPPY